VDSNKREGVFFSATVGLSVLRHGVTANHRGRAHVRAPPASKWREKPAAKWRANPGVMHHHQTAFQALPLRRHIQYTARMNTAWAARARRLAGSGNRATQAAQAAGWGWQWAAQARATMRHSTGAIRPSIRAGVGVQDT